MNTLAPVPTRGTISFHSLGCKANHEEMECLLSRLGSEGFRVVPFGEPADWTVINTCTVTQSADSDSRQLLRRAARTKAAGRVVATGCLAQRDPAGVAAIPGVDWVIGNGEKPYLAQWIIDEGARADGGRAGVEERAQVRVIVGADPTLAAFPSYGIARDGRRRRATLKIQDGCDEHCTFCIIPEVRGSSRSRPMEDVRRDAETLAASGYREIALTGINTALWGRDLRSDREGHVRELPDLIDGLAGLPGLRRIRLNSLEPRHIEEAWIARFADTELICRHFHFPLQSGDAAVLRRMNRRYGPGDYARLVERVRTRMPDAAIGCDVMVGFPGESDRSFEATRSLLAAMPLAYVHVFTYSERPGTAAPRLGAKVPDGDKGRRSTALRRLGTEIRRRFAGSQVGTRQEVLIEAASGAGHWQGLTGNYLRVRIPWTAEEPPEPGGTIVPVLLTGVGDDGVMTGIAEGHRA